MDRLNKKLIIAGLTELIKNEKKAFIERLTYYLQERPKLVDFLMDGFISTNEEIQKQIITYIKSSLPCPEYFKGITSIQIAFDYDQSQQYVVQYKVCKFYDENGQPYSGMNIPDEEHKQERIYSEKVYINPDILKNN